MLTFSNLQAHFKQSFVETQQGNKYVIMLLA